MLAARSSAVTVRLPSNYSAPADTASAAPAPASCDDQLSAWKEAGLSQLAAIGGAQGSISKDALTMASDLQAGNDLTADESAMQTGAATLQSAVTAAQGNLPPSCVPSLRPDFSAALGYYRTDAADSQAAVAAAGAGNDNLAAAEISAANTALNQGNAKIAAPTGDLRPTTTAAACPRARPKTGRPSR